MSEATANRTYTRACKAGQALRVDRPAIIKVVRAERGRATLRVEGDDGEVNVLHLKPHDEPAKVR